MMQFRQVNNKQKQNNNDTNNLALQHYSMTAVRNNTLEETMTNQEVGYGAIDDTNPEPQKTPHKITQRTTYGILLFVISFFLVAGAGATRSSLRSDTASIVVSSEGYPSVTELKKAADLAQGKADAAVIVVKKKGSSGSCRGGFSRGGFGSSKRNQHRSYCSKDSCQKRRRTRKSSCGDRDRRSR